MAHLSPESTALVDARLGANGGDAQDAGSSQDNNHTLAIALSTALSVLAVVIIAGSIFICCRYHQGRLPFAPRGVTPIDDEEIESWKKKEYSETVCDEPTSSPAVHKKNLSTASLRKPPSVVVYQNDQQPLWSPPDNTSPRSFGSNGNTSRKSFDVPQTPVLARAPNARPGLTDESVQGDEAFLPRPQRRPSRLSKHKYPPNASISSTRGHGRTVSTRSSFSFSGSTRDQWPGHGFCTDAELTPRASHDDLTRSTSGITAPPRAERPYSSHHRVYSSSSIPPRLSLEDVYFVNQTSPRALPTSEIGRAIG